MSEAIGSIVATRRSKGGWLMVAMVKKGNVCLHVSVVRRQYGRIAKAEKERRLGVLLQCRMIPTAEY